MSHFAQLLLKSVQVQGVPLAEVLRILQRHDEATQQVQKYVLDQCSRYFDDILQVLKLKTQTKAASRARTGCGSNQ